MADCDNDAPTRRRRSSRLAVEQGDGGEEEEARRRRHRKRKRRHSRNDDLPFHVIVMQVGATLFTLCFVTFYLWQSIFAGSAKEELEQLLEPWYDDDVSLHAAKEEQQLNEEEVEDWEEEGAMNQEPTVAPTKPTAPPLPVWDLGEATKYDAFAIANIYQGQQAETGATNQAFWTTARSLRTQFADLYGGENAVRAMMERGFTTFPMTLDPHQKLPNDLVHTACRIKNAKQQGRAFKFTFGGYSVTVGRGNYFGQSFPFVMKRLLETPFQLLGINLSVKNAAIGGCPSFPYGFCKKNHWGEDSDVVSWDFSMNEAGGVAEGLEAYLRHTMTLSHRPKLIVKDTYMADKRRDVVKRYVELGAIKDPIVMHSDPAARPFLDRREDFRPEGFQNWRKFGSPPGAPGQALHHPAVKEHEMLGWMLTMHFLSALELFAASEEEATNSGLQFTCPSPEETNTNLLPPPITVNATAMKEWSSLFFGVPNDKEPHTKQRVIQEWRMNPVHCKTAYDPIVDQSGSLTSIVVSGSTGEDMNVMLPKGHMFYNKAWVFDLSEAEKEAKRKLDRFGGLGYVDSKKAYRGLFTSGTLKLLLPYYKNDHLGAGKETVGQPKVGDSARDWFQNVVVCEVNERSEPGACQSGKDITFGMGGVNATEVTMLDTPGTLYLGKKICTHVKIPADAKITSKEAILLEDPLLPNSQKRSLNEAIQANKTLVGLSFELSVHNHLIIARDKACSISHVIWEQRTPGVVRFPLKQKPSLKDAALHKDTESPMKANPYAKATPERKTKSKTDDAKVKPVTTKQSKPKGQSMSEGSHAQAKKPEGPVGASPINSVDVKTQLTSRDGSEAKSQARDKAAKANSAPKMKDVLKKDQLNAIQDKQRSSAMQDKLRGMQKEKVKAAKTESPKDDLMETL